MKTFLIFFICYVVFAYCAVYVEKSPPGTPPNKCKSSFYELGTMSAGKEKQVPNKCMVARCYKDGEIVFAGCGTVSGSDDCKLINDDLSKSYPECCKKYDCPQ